MISELAKQLTITVGITTCYGEASIVDTVRSIRASQNIPSFRFIIVADRVPVPPAVKQELATLGVELVERPGSASQLVKQKLILSMTTSDLLVFTQDDVLFAPDTLARIVRKFAEHPRTTFVAVNNTTAQPQNRFEAALNVGTRVAMRMAELWRGGDNYLAVVGRLMAFRTAWLKTITIPDNVVSSDAYFYFENKRRGGTFAYLPQAAIVFRNPQNMKEHLRKSARFQHSKREMVGYFGPDIVREYFVPTRAKIRAMLEEALRHPLSFAHYVAVYAYSRFMCEQPKTALNANWEVDRSTKQVA